MTVEEIVADVRERGDAALREWSLELDGVEPARAEPTSAPEEAVLALAARVRRWHEGDQATIPVPSVGSRRIGWVKIVEGLL